MKKNLSMYLGLFLSVLLISSGLLASPKIMNKEVEGKKVHFTQKNGQAVNKCDYCHKVANIEKKKLGYLKGETNFQKIKGIQNCAGSGCH